MAKQGRSSFIQLVVVLLVAGGIRAGLRDRTPPTSLPGAPVDLQVLSDSAARIAMEEERRSRPLEAGERLDPNTAPAPELDRLPGVGEATALAIVAARDSLPFQTVDDLVRVRGIGPGTLARLSSYLEVTPGNRGRVGRSPSPSVGRSSGRGVSARAVPAGATRPLLAGRSEQRSQGSGTERVAVNLAGMQELQALPGVGRALARRILEVRSRTGIFRSPEDLMAVRGIGPATVTRMVPFLDFRVR